MKVQFLLRGTQIDAIRLLANIYGTILSERLNGMYLIEYDITTDKIMILESLLSQKGSIVKEEKQWPSEGDTYYYIDDEGDILNSTWYCSEDISYIDHLGRRNIGNIFKTEIEAQFEFERLKVLNELKSLSDDDQEWNCRNIHYQIVYEVPDNELDVLPICSVIHIHPYWFKSKESARSAIKAIGEDKLKKYVFNIKEEKE